MYRVFHCSQRRRDVKGYYGVIYVVYFLAPIVAEILLFWGSEQKIATNSGISSLPKNLPLGSCLFYRIIFYSKSLHFKKIALLLPTFWRRSISIR